jgi:tripartite-type tricarboxylate transporter receptor subunit TctC
MITKRFACAMVATGIALCAGGMARAQSYPERLIRLIVPAPPGGQTDVLARYVGQTMQAALGRNVMIENRPGAGGAMGARAAAAAEPDGYTLFFGNTSTLAVIPAVAKEPGYDPIRNFAPVASISESYMILVVNPSFPAKTTNEFLAYARANPGKLNFAHSGGGNVTQLTGEMFKSLAGIDFVGVPHKGGAECVTAVLGGQVDFALESPVILLPIIRQGQLRALGVTIARRSPQAPEIPTMIEGGVPDFVATTLTGLVAPAGTPPGIIARLNAVINESLHTREMQATLATLGSQPRIGTAQEFASFLSAETRKWGAVAQKAGVRLD